MAEWSKALVLGTSLRAWVRIPLQSVVFEKKGKQEKKKRKDKRRKKIEKNRKKGEKKEKAQQDGKKSEQSITLKDAWEKRRDRPARPPW
jgi:hypothetical protein